MKRFKKWLAGVISAAKVDEKKVRRYLTAIGALVATAGYQVLDVGVAAIVAMDAKELAKRFVVCFAMGLLGALIHGGPIKAILLEDEAKGDPAAVLAAVAVAQKAEPAAATSSTPASGAPSAT